MPSLKKTLAKRSARIAHLYFIEGCEVTDIVEKLLEEEPELLRSRSLDGATKTVRNAVAALKAQRRADGDLDTDDGTEKERHVARMLYSIRKLIATIEDESVLTKVIGMTKDGTPVTTEVPSIPPGVKQKAMKDLAAISERLAVVTGVQIGKLEGANDGAEDEALGSAEFAFNFSGKTLADLLRVRTGKGEVN